MTSINPEHTRSHSVHLNADRSIKSVDITIEGHHPEVPLLEQLHCSGERPSGLLSEYGYYGPCRVLRTGLRESAEGAVEYSYHIEVLRPFEAEEVGYRDFSEDVDGPPVHGLNLSRDELDLVREWYCALQDRGGWKYLERKDYELIDKIRAFLQVRYDVSPAERHHRYGAPL